MISYEQIKSVEKQLYDALNDFKSVINSRDFSEILTDARKYQAEMILPTDLLLSSHDKMLKKLYTYAINNVPRDDAKMMIVAEFNHKENIVLERLVDYVYIKQKRKMTLNKIYAAHMMKRAGLSNKKIAVTLGVTLTAISKYLKIDIDFKKPMDN